jgi:V8-like Glu-specific endopeptidase
MPALKKVDKKVDKKGDAIKKASGLHVNEKGVKRRLEQNALNKVLEKDITCAPSNMGLPSGSSVPGCLPQFRNGVKFVDKENGGKQPTEDAPEDDRSKEEEKKSAGASSFWNHWSSKLGTSGDSLHTGKGNRVVPRSLRDAREDAVCMIESKGRTGSGFYVLVQGKLGILTNNHVLPDKKAASIAVATFNTANMGTVEVALYPQKLFQTSPKDELDYSLVACEVPQGIQPMKLLHSELPEVQPGDTIVIVQHPDGGEKSASSGPVHQVHPPYVTYEADTEVGSSGSPGCSCEPADACKHNLVACAGPHAS